MGRILVLAISFIVFLTAMPVMELNKAGNKVNDDYLSCTPENLSGVFDDPKGVYIFEGKKVNLPKLAYTEPKTKVLGSVLGTKWIEVDLSEQKLKAWEDGSLFLESPVSTGLPATPTPTGEFNIWIKLRSTRMRGGSGKYYYNLPNVPYVMYFSSASLPGSRGYGLHGAYWHNDFGTRRSHGCVNLPIPVAEQLYYWTTPTLAEGKTTVKATNENLGTKIVIHE